jgi:alkylhydroperoxidase/carboxymuconolactone decarboxylase family protein YurZ
VVDCDEDGLCACIENNVRDGTFLDDELCAIVERALRSAGNTEDELEQMIEAVNAGCGWQLRS